MSKLSMVLAMALTITLFSKALHASPEGSRFLGRWAINSCTSSTGQQNFRYSPLIEMIQTSEGSYQIHRFLAPQDANYALLSRVTISFNDQRVSRNQFSLLEPALRTPVQATEYAELKNGKIKIDSEFVGKEVGPVKGFVTDAQTIYSLTSDRELVIERNYLFHVDGDQAPTSGYWSCTYRSY